MDRFTETIHPAARFDRDEDGYSITPGCENCGRTGLRLTVTPTLYMACDDCMEECLAVIERKATATLTAIREEAAVLLAPVLQLLQTACPVCGSTRLEKCGPFTACVNCKQIWNPASGRMVA